MLHAMILKKFDKDGDGKLNEAERAAAQAQFKANHPEWFAKADADDNGKISPEERKAVRPVVREKLLEKFDKDGDGKLDEAERKAAKEAFRARQNS